MNNFLKGGSSRSAAASRGDCSWKRLCSRPSAGGSSSSSQSKAKPSSRKRKADNLTQTYLDLGQKSFARIIECPVCGLAYTHGEEADEAAHQRYHRMAIQGVCIRGTLASLHCLGEQADGTQLIALNESDGAEARRKVVEATSLIDSSVGSTEVPQHFRAYLCLEPSTGRVRSFAIAQPLTRAYRAVPPAANDDDGVLSHDGVLHEAMCGISHIWVALEHRRRGLACALLDAVRRHFALGILLPKDQIGFSGPTTSGRRLAAAYTGAEGFLVYD